MPTTRRGAEAPERGVQQQEPRNTDNRNIAQNFKNQPLNVRSSRRSPGATGTNQPTPRRTRGSDLEPEPMKDVNTTVRSVAVVKPNHTVRQSPSSSIRKSKRSASESPKIITTKKPKTDLDNALPTASKDRDTSSDGQPKIVKRNDKLVASVHKEVKTDESVTEIDNDSLKTDNTGLKGLTVKAGKSLKPEEVADVLSPRRSSRSVVPNSRFKDMVDLGKKKAVVKTVAQRDMNISTSKKPKIDYTLINVQQQSEASEITEEIITEETKIDPLAQMNLMDEMLVLPPTSTEVTAEITTEADIGFMRGNRASSGIRIIKYSSSKLVGDKTESEEAHIEQGISEEIAERIEEIHGEATNVSHGVDSYDENDKVTNSSNILPGEIAPEPQVIVIPGETGISKIIIPKDPYRARLEQAFENKGGSMMIGPSTGKLKSKKLIVTPTHQHVVKKDSHRTKTVEYGEKIQLPESVLGKSEGKPTVTSVIYPWTQKARVSTGQTIHTEELTRTTVAESSIETNISCVRTSSAMPLGSSTTVKPNKPHVKVVYVKTKPKEATNKLHDTGKTHGVQIVRIQDSAGIKGISSDLRINTQISNENKDAHIEQSELISKEINNVNNSTTETAGQISVKNGDNSVSDNTQSTEGVEQVTSIPVEQNIANSLCQVIEYKQQPQTAIEYVLLDNKMVPIHKPFQTGHHGRGLSGRRTEVVHRVTPGRVEPGGHKEQGGDYFKKIPLSTAQSAISTVLSQIEDGDITPMSRNLDLKYTIASQQQGSPDEELSGEISTAIQQPRVIHGYIDHPVKSGSPTQIVEISTEAFNKEIYGEEVSLDTVTGELVQPSSGSRQIEIIPIQSVSLADLTSGNQSIQTVSLPEITSGNQSVTEAANIQIVREPDDRSVRKPVQTVTVSSDNGATVVYSGEDDSGEISNWPGGAPNVSSDSNVIINASEVPTEDGIVQIDGLDTSQIPENATVTVEKLASGGEIVIMQIKESALTKTLNKIKTSAASSTDHSIKSFGRKPPSIVQATVLGKPQTEPLKKYPYNVRINPSIMKLPEVKVTPVRAYEKPKSGPSEPNDNVVSKTTGTNTDDQEADIEEEDEEEEEEEGIPMTEIGSKKDAPYQEYIVVRLPEGTEIKKFESRPKKEKTPLGEEVTMDSDGMYICVDCGHKTENRGNWFKHRRKHLGIRPHACQRCSYKAATSSNLKRHMQIHDDVRNFLCIYCNQLFRQKIHLERHLKYKHEEKNVQCPLCDYVCSSEDPDLKNHIKRRHMPQEGALNAFTCDVCGLMTVSKKDLKQHKKFHKNGPELKMFCEHCSFVTDCVSRLRRHMLIHSKERPFQCGLCTYRATQKEHVLRHMRSQHGVEVERNQRRSLLEKNYNNPQEILIAGIDQASSTSTTTVTKETLPDVDIGPFEKSDYSSTDKIFACNYCSMKFAKLINLYKHLYAQHKQVMPDEGPNDFQCVVCDFHTNSKKNLLVHMRKHNMQDHSPPTHVYSCVLCRYINPRRRNLFQHMKKKHGIEIIMKDDGLNCYVTLDNAAAQVQGQSVKSSVMALSDIVTTQPMDDATQMEFMTGSAEDVPPFHAEKITIDNIMPDDMESYVVSDTSQEHNMVSPQVSISSVLHASVQEHEAAEAIEGLQALAEQAGILETQNVDNDMTSEIVSSAIEIVSTHEMNEEEALNSGDTIIKDESTLVEAPAEGNEGFEVSTDQLNQLATGDFVEINGEVYKVEIAPEGS